jgi:hypothetical protein
VVGGPKQSVYWKNIKVVQLKLKQSTKKNPIAIASFKGDEVKSRHGYRGTWSLKDGDENAVIEGWTHWSLPQSNGKLDNLKMEYVFKKAKLLIYQ